MGSYGVTSDSFLPYRATLDAVHRRYGVGDSGGAQADAAFLEYLNDIPTGSSIPGLDSFFSGLLSGRLQDVQIEVAFAAHAVARHLRDGSYGNARSLFWERFRGDFREQERLHDHINTITLHMLAGGSTTFTDADIETLRDALRTTVGHGARFATYTLPQRTAVREIPEVGVVHSVANRLNNFQGGALYSIGQDLDPANPDARKFLAEDLGDLSSALRNHRDPFKTLQYLFVLNAHTLPRAEVVLPEELPRVETQEPVALLELLFEVVRMGAEAGRVEQKNRIEFVWIEAERQLAVHDSAGALRRAYDDGRIGATLFAGIGVNFTVSPLVGPLQGVAFVVPPAMVVP